MWWTWLIIILAGALAYRWWEMKRKIYPKSTYTPSPSENNNYSNEVLKKVEELARKAKINKKSIPPEQEPDVPGAASSESLDDQIVQRQASTTENPSEFRIKALDFDNYDQDFDPKKIIIYDNKDKYLGSSNNEGFRHGIGKYYYYSNKSIYLGEWKNGKRTGYGILKWPSNDKYEGYWLNGKMYGQGTYHFSKGDVFVGKWVDGCKEGYGVYKFSIGDQYEGNWVNDLRTGYGTYYYANGNKYVGEFLNSKFNGQGKFSYANGRVEEGEWENGKFLG